jgi:hypothetical protein
LSAENSQEPRALGLIADRRALEELARVEPLDVEVERAQVCGAELGGGQLAGREDSGVHARAHLANELDTGNRLLEAAKALVENRGIHFELAREHVVLRADLVKPLVRVVVGDGGVEQRNERVRHADERGMHDDGPDALREPVAQQLRDHGPVRGRRNAPSAELQHDPGRVRIRRIDGLAHAERCM